MAIIWEYEPSMLEIHSKIEYMSPPEMEDHEDLRSVDDMEKVAIEHDVSVSTEDDMVLIPLRMQREEKEQTLLPASQHVGRGMRSEETGQPHSFVSKNTPDANNSFECEGRSVEEIVQSVNITASSEGRRNERQLMHKLRVCHSSLSLKRTAGPGMKCRTWPVHSVGKDR